jgi:hypothetical protein
VFTVNHRARALYQRLGMTEVARHGDSNVKITMRSGHPGPDRKKINPQVLTIARNNRGQPPARTSTYILR